MNELARSFALAFAPDAVMTRAGMPPDPWQRDLLRSESKEILIVASRQSGKSTVTAALAAHTVIADPSALVLLLSPSLRQSQELFRKVRDFLVAANIPHNQESALRVELAGGARVIALPGTEETVRGYSGVSLLVVDEAARCDDGLYYSLRPMLAVSGGRICALTTPWGRRGWFYDEWEHGGGRWHRFRVTAAECPRITEEFLAVERIALPGFWFRQEYECSFEETADTIFSIDLIRSAFSADVKPFTAEDFYGPSEAATVPQSTKSTTKRLIFDE